MFRHRLLLFFPLAFVILLVSQVFHHHLHGRTLVFAEHFLIGVWIALIVFGFAWRSRQVSK